MGQAGSGKRGKVGAGGKTKSGTINLCVLVHKGIAYQAAHYFRSGIVARSFDPPPGSVEILKLPWTRRMRSSMLARPSPPSLRAELKSKPEPESTTCKQTARSSIVSVISA